MKEYILVSACLLGRNTKYNGKNNLVDNIEALKSKYNILPICPEVSGGLPIPRLPSEISIDRVISSLGDDVTINFYKGANITLKLALKYHVTFADGTIIVLPSIGQLCSASASIVISDVEGGAYASVGITGMPQIGCRIEP